MSGPLNRTVMWLTWRQLFAKRRVWLAVAFALAAPFFTLVFKVFVDDGPAAETTFFNTLMREIVIGTLLPIAALVFGAAAFGGEADDGTLLYLLTKPIARWQILSSKLVVAVLSTMSVALPAVGFSWVILSGPEVPGHTAAAYLYGAIVGSVLYSAIFVALGLASKRAVVVGLLYIISIEGIVTRGFAATKSISVREFCLSITQAASAGAVTIDNALPVSTAWRMGALIFALAMGWTALRLVRYEVAERV